MSKCKVFTFFQLLPRASPSQISCVRRCPCCHFRSFVEHWGSGCPALPSASSQVVQFSTTPVVASQRPMYAVCQSVSLTVVDRGQKMFYLRTQENSSSTGARTRRRSNNSGRITISIKARCIAWNSRTCDTFVSFRSVPRSGLYFSLQDFGTSCETQIAQAWLTKACSFTNFTLGKSLCLSAVWNQSRTLRNTGWNGRAPVALIGLHLGCMQSYTYKQGINPPPNTALSIPPKTHGHTSAVAHVQLRVEYCVQMHNKHQICHW